jgi:hypothetical protein
MSGIVLTLVYPGPFATAQLETLRLEEHGFTVRHMFQETLPREVTAHAYARALYERCRLSEVDVASIVSYCAAGEIAGELALMCARGSARRVRMIRINPEFPTLDVLVRTIEAGLRHPLPRPNVGDLTLDGLTLQLFEELEKELTDKLLERVGGSGQAARDLSRMQVDWVVHLVAAGRTTSRLDMAEELHLTASDHPCASECPARHVVVCDDSADVFSAPAVIEAIRG